MRPRHLALAAALLMAVPLAACGSDDSTGSATTAASATGDVAAAPAEVPVLVSADEAEALLAAGGMRIIDVRTPEEFAAGYIAGAENLDLTGGAFSEALGGLDPEATYFVYCRSGNRSATATAEMAAAGFTKVYELTGGIQAWEAAGLPLAS